MARAVRSSIQGVKHDFSGAYNRKWPHAYFRAHLALDYMLPDRAKPVFERIFADYRRVRNKAKLKIIDIGCSYGVNAALLRADLDLDDLYAAYSSGSLSGRHEIEHRAFFRNRGLRDDIQFVGVDPSFRAIRYARNQGLLEAGIPANLETGDLTIKERCALADADIIISTGCVGYATDRTFARVYDASAASRPWVVVFAMHPFSYDDIAAALRGYGLETRSVDRFRQRQRRFSTPTERQAILTAMTQLGIEDRLERTTGYVYASCYISAPRGEVLYGGILGSASGEMSLRPKGFDERCLSAMAVPCGRASPKTGFGSCDNP
ncbi:MULTISPECIES: class I SAM-dependent methyltransferase [Mesorhizobium]|uniref:class I SAM-dependent methyltransferase n=1 Tax=Mesorhizobium TaxID=68287 RepID=UPI001FCED486|nr:MULTISPECIES: class I SAM-dependent methyltransferase [Mesorhizobium]